MDAINRQATRQARLAEEYWTLVAPDSLVLQISSKWRQDEVRQGIFLQLITKRGAKWNQEEIDHYPHRTVKAQNFTLASQQSTIFGRYVVLLGGIRVYVCTSDSW